MMKHIGRTVIRIGSLAWALLSVAGCSQPTLFPNPDPSLRKSVAEFRKDAAARFPYKADAPKTAEPRARAQVDYDLNRIELVNFSDQDWKDVEVWVNRHYVCHLPMVQSRVLKQIDFPMLFNEMGQSFPLDNRQILVQTVELYREGQMYQIVCHPAGF